MIRRQCAFVLLLFVVTASCEAAPVIASRCYKGCSIYLNVCPTLIHTVEVTLAGSLLIPRVTFGTGTFGPNNFTEARWWEWLITTPGFQEQITGLDPVPTPGLWSIWGVSQGWIWEMELGGWYDPDGLYDDCATAGTLQ